VLHADPQNGLSVYLLHYIRRRRKKRRGRGRGRRKKKNKKKKKRKKKIRSDIYLPKVNTE